MGHEQVWPTQTRPAGGGVSLLWAAKTTPPANQSQAIVPGSRKDRRVRARPEAGVHDDQTEPPREAAVSGDGKDEEHEAI
jgi:hypothetical protein